MVPGILGSPEVPAALEALADPEGLGDLDCLEAQ